MENQISCIEKRKLQSSWTVVFGMDVPSIMECLTQMSSTGNKKLKETRKEMYLSLKDLKKMVGLFCEFGNIL